MLLWNQDSISNGFRDIKAQVYLGHDLNLHRSRDNSTRSMWYPIGVPLFHPLSWTALEILSFKYIQKQRLASGSRLMVAHARILLPVALLQRSFLVHGTEKVCSKFGEDRSINDVTSSLTAAGWRTDTGRTPDGHRTDTTRYVKLILYSVQCYAWHWTEKNIASWKNIRYLGVYVSLHCCFFLTYLKVETGSGYQGNCNQVAGS